MYNIESNAPLHVALILGSARQTGWTRKLARELAELAPAGLVLREVTIADLPLYHEEREEPAPPTEWLRFRAEILATHAVLFVTPEYNRSVPAALKNAIDIGSSPDDHSVWAGKPAAIVSHSPGRMGGFGANHHMRQSLVFLDMPVLQQPEVYLAQVDKLFDADGRLVVAPVRARLGAFLDAFSAWIATTKRHVREGASQ